MPDAFAYDLSSGVEASPGVKDHEKLKQLFANTLVQETKMEQFQTPRGISDSSGVSSYRKPLWSLYVN